MPTRGLDAQSLPPRVVRSRVAGQEAALAMGCGKRGPVRDPPLRTSAPPDAWDHRAPVERLMKVLVTSAA
jgi:hypothetical protein